MTELRTPLKEYLRAELPQSDVQRLWSKIAARRGARQRTSVVRVALVAAVAGAMLALLVLWPKTPPGGPGALLTVDGKTPVTLDAAREGLARFVDGSSIELGQGAKLDVLNNDGERFIAMLRRGQAKFAVRPGGPRRWTIETGVASVEVVGTRFSISRSDQTVEVKVEHGVVLVRAERLPDGAQRLSAGDLLRIGPEPAAALAPASGAGAVESAGAPAPDDSAAAPAAAPSELDGALSRADSARARGDVEAAISELERAVRAPGDGSRRSTAAFTLGKLLLDGAGRPAQAAAAFGRCLALQPPAALAEDALARLVEARSRAGDAAGARAAAAEYERRYPAGRRLQAVREWGGAD
jgi:transmembrane sensor